MIGRVNKATLFDSDLRLQVATIHNLMTRLRAKLFTPLTNRQRLKTDPRLAASITDDEPLNEACSQQ
jgi:hypothetical protein